MRSRSIGENAMVFVRRVSIDLRLLVVRFAGFPAVLCILLTTFLFRSRSRSLSRSLSLSLSLSRSRSLSLSLSLFLN